jgi:hypothetical protein
MFMRYRGGGVGHATNHYEGDDDAMDIDEDDADKENTQDLEPSDERLVQELLRIASGAAHRPTSTSAREELEHAMVMDPDEDEEDDSEEERDSAAVMMGNEEEENLGPEDGENEDYIDTGYGAL